MKEKTNETSKNIKIAFYLNIFFSILECIGGLLTNSISIISDSIHDFGDALSIGVSYLFEKKSNKLPNNKYTYGYLRYSLLGALFTSLVLLLGSIIVIYNAILRIKSPVSINYEGMIIFAIFGIIINGYAAYKTSKGNKTNEKVISLHMLEDVLGWIAVLVGSIIMKIFNLPLIDPILSIIIAIYILIHVYKYIKETFDIFMEKVPDDITIEDIKNSIINKYNNISDIHHIHIWSLDGINNYLTAHVKLKSMQKEEDIILLKGNIKKQLYKNNIKHATLEIEYYNESCENDICTHL